MNFSKVDVLVKQPIIDIEWKVLDFTIISTSIDN